MAALLEEMVAEIEVAQKVIEDAQKVQDGSLVIEAVCRVCGKTFKGEVLPFRDCRFCGESPCWHHGRCCAASPLKCPVTPFGTDVLNRGSGHSVLAAARSEKKLRILKLEQVD